VSTYREFLRRKTHEGAEHGFAPNFMPDALFDFQVDLVEWSVRKGRAAIFADCGLGKTPMQLTWAENVHRHTNRPVLILTPLAVSAQTIREAAKFDIPAVRADDRLTGAGINVTNYERLHHFDPSDFAGVVLDESSILKSFNGARRQQLTAFMRKIPYRLLATATAAPNDYIELGTSAEALGEMGAMDMLNKFFKNDMNNSATRRMYGEAPKWRFKGHAEQPFWRWVTSWARAMRKPSDLGYDDGPFILPPLHERRHLVEVNPLDLGRLFDMPAATLEEQRDESRRSITERCERVAEGIPAGEPAIVWCHLNEEGKTLTDMIPDATEVAGNHTDQQKEDRLLGFAEGRYRVLVTKPRIGAWGLNYQHCAHISYFPSHSYEQYYQAVRRCWRFGQERPVTVDIILTEGQKKVMANLHRKSEQADAMFANLVAEMNDSIAHRHANPFTNPERMPAWL
jgi:hypothetical protein